jgi:hypothetical protein
VRRRLSPERQDIGIGNWCNKKEDGGWEVKNQLDLRDGERSEAVQQAKGKS